MYSNLTQFNVEPLCNTLFRFYFIRQATRILGNSCGSWYFAIRIIMQVTSIVLVTNPGAKTFRGFGEFIDGIIEKIMVVQTPYTTSGHEQSNTTEKLRHRRRNLLAGAARVKPRPHERGTDAELCVSSPQFTRHRRKFVQTLNFVQISWHCLHKIAGGNSYHSSHLERRCTGVVCVRWMSEHYTKIINWHCENKNTIILYSSRLNWEKNIFQTVV